MATKNNPPDDENTTTKSDKDADSTANKEDARTPSSQDRNRVQQGSEPTDADQQPKSEAEAHAEREAAMTEEEKSRHQYQTTRLPGEVTVNEGALVAGLKPQEAKRIETSGSRDINFDVPTGARPEEVAQDYPRPSGNVGKDLVSGQTGRDVISDRLAAADGARNRQFQQDADAAARNTIREREDAQRQAQRANAEQNLTDANRRQPIPVGGQTRDTTADRGATTTTRTAAKDMDTPPVKDSSTKK